jgi:hypothetical protein
MSLIGPKLRKGFSRFLAPAISEATTTATAPLTRLIAIPAKHRAIATRFKRYGCGLATSRTNHRSTLRWSRTVTGTPATLIVLLCLTASLAPLWGRITTFLKERLIRRGESKVLPAVTTRKLHISGHGSPRGDCTAQQAVCVKSYSNPIKFIRRKRLQGFHAPPMESSVVVFGSGSRA